MNETAAMTLHKRSARYALGVFCVCASGLCFGFLGFFGRMSFQAGLSIGELLSYRFTLATFILGLGLVGLRPQLLRISRRDFLGCALLGATGYTMMSTLYFTAIRGTSLAVASLLLYTYPVLVTLGAWIIFSERPTRGQKIALPLAVAGLFLVIDPTGLGTSSFLAIAAGLGAAVTYSAYILASSRIQKDIHPITSGFYVMLSASVSLALIHRPDLSRITDFTIAIWLTLAGIAIVCTVIPLALFLMGLQIVGNTETSLLSTIEPITATGLGFLFLHESLQQLQWLGGALVLTSLAITALGSKPSPSIQSRNPPS